MKPNTVTKFVAYGTWPESSVKPAKNEKSATIVEIYNFFKGLLLALSVYNKFILESWQ